MNRHGLRTVLLPAARGRRRGSRADWRATQPARAVAHVQQHRPESALPRGRARHRLARRRRCRVRGALPGGQTTLGQEARRGGDSRRRSLRGLHDRMRCESDLRLADLRRRFDRRDLDRSDDLRGARPRRRQDAYPRRRRVQGHGLAVPRDDAGRGREARRIDSLGLRAIRRHRGRRPTRTQP